MATGGSTAALTGTPPERLNFFRACRIILDDIPVVLRSVFRNVYLRKHGVSWSPEEGETLRKSIKSVRFSSQKDLLDDGDPEKWDPSLLCLVLLDAMWQTKFTSFERCAISDLRDLRNDYFAHYSKACMTNSDFTQLVTAVKKAYADLLSGKARTLSINRMIAICNEDVFNSIDVIAQLERCKEHNMKLTKEFETFWVQIDNEMRQLKTELQEQSERIQHQEEISYEVDQRLSDVETAQRNDHTKLQEHIQHHEETSHEVDQRLGDVEAVQRKDHAKVQEQSERIQHQEETSYEVDQRLSDVETAQREDHTMLADIHGQLKKRGIVADVQDGISSLTLQDYVQTAPKASKKKIKKQEMYPKSTLGDNEMDSGLSTSDETLELPQVTVNEVNANSHTVLDVNKETLSDPHQYFYEQGNAVLRHDLSGPGIHPASVQESGQHNQTRCRVPESVSTCTPKVIMYAPTEGAGPRAFEGSETLKIKLENAEQEIEDINHECNKLKEEKAYIEHELEAAERKLKQITDDNEELRRQHVHVDELRKELHEKNEELHRLNGIVADQREQITSWKLLSQRQEKLLECTGISHRERERLGGGAFGTVYKVTIDGEYYAAKELNNVFDPTKMPEFHLLPRLKHKNIVCYHGSNNCITGKRPTLIMELMATNLHVHIQSRRITTCDKLQIVRNILCGLNYLHSHIPIIIHRDLNAKNVLLDSSGVAKIADFGNARLIKDNQLSSLSCGIGTLGYRAPELFGEHYDEKVDIFSFGHLLLFIFIDKYPGKILSYLDETDDGKPIYLSEVERRGHYVKTLHQECTKLKLQVVEKTVRDCLSNKSKSRPSASNLCETFSLIQYNNLDNEA